MFVVAEVNLGNQVCEDRKNERDFKSRPAALKYARRFHSKEDDLGPWENELKNEPISTC